MAGYPSRVYLNGEMLPAAEARVSVFDRGFVFADGVYEVIPVYGGRAFRLSQHLRRLAASLEAVRIVSPHRDAEWESVVSRLIRDADGGDLYVYLQITRGAAPRDHVIPPDAKPTVFAYAQPIVPDPGRVALGIAVTLVEDMRWRRCDVKVIGLLANILARDEATRAGSAEALFVRDGFVPEGSSSNVFAVTQGEIRTPPKGPSLLPGVTRDVVLELARNLGLATREVPITEAEIMNADEVWITSSVREIVAVVTVNGFSIGGGHPGPVHARLATEFQAYKRRFADGSSE